MERRARGGDSDEEWRRIAGGFQAHVLVWERESLMLPVSEALGLGPPPPDSQAVRHAFKWIRERHPRYEKAVHGPKFLEQIAADHGLRERVLAHTPSLKAIVDELVALP